MMTLNRAAIAHNIDLMAQFCSDHDVDLAPHAKTTMSPELVRRQLDAGAWAMTAATVAQARILREFGVDTIVIASQVLDPAAFGGSATPRPPIPISSSPPSSTPSRASG
ncbi:hypothetical protein GCM10020255_053040 [Rhodococcus baikonurensis]